MTQPTEKNTAAIATLATPVRGVSRVLAITLMAVATLIVPATAAHAATITYAKILASDYDAQARFGSSVALSSDGNTALTGSFYKGGGASPSTAYVHTRTGVNSWTEDAQIASSDGVPRDGFGGTVALSADGNTAVVGAQLAAVGGVTGAGAVYIFSRDGGVWSEVAKLTQQTPGASASFGGSLALSDAGDHLVVGAPTDPTKGSAYFFRRDAVTGSWSQNGSTTGLSDNSLLGLSVAISGNGTVAAIGMPYYSYMSGTRRVYQPTVITFARNVSGTAWSLQKVIASPGALGHLNSFGSSLSLSQTGTTLLAGAENTSTFNAATVAGAAFVFSYASGNWGSVVVLYRSATANRDFGEAVALSPDGNTALIGQTKGNGTSGAGGGAAFTYVRSGATWPAGLTFTAVGIGTDDSFGSALSLSAGASRPIIGAFVTPYLGLAFVGAAYFFEVS